MIGKKVVPGKGVVDIELGDDPSDADLIRCLHGADDIVTFPTAKGFEVVVGTGSGKALLEAGVLVVGAPPALGEERGRQSAAELDDEQVRNLIRVAFDNFGRMADIAK